MGNRTLKLIVLLSLFSPLLALSSIDIVVTPACYKSGETLTLLINLPKDLGDSISSYQLKISLKGNNLSLNEVLSGDQITLFLLEKEKIGKIPELQKTAFQKGMIISFPVKIPEDVTGGLIIDLEFLLSGETISMLKTYIAGEPECPVTKDKNIKINELQPNVVSAAKKDYRERFIYGDITIDETSWPGFILIIKAEKSAGGGVEKVYIKTREPGTYSYRLGNLYPGEYIFEVMNLETDVNMMKVNFGPEDISRKIDIRIPKITPVNFILYHPEIVDIIPRPDGTFSYQIKAYACRFDDSKVRNLSINWRCAGIYHYNTPAPEKGRCVPLYPALITLRRNEQIKIEMQINTVFIKEVVMTSDNLVLETDRNDNDAEILIIGGK